MSDTIELSLDELLTTTRAVRRRMDFDRPVPLEVITDCVRIAVQAPSGSNRQGWHWIVITDPDQRARLAELYRAAFDEYRASATHGGGLFAADGQHSSTQKRIAGSVEYLAQNLHRVPVLLLACITAPGSAVLPDATAASMCGARCFPRCGVTCLPPGPAGWARCGPICTCATNSRWLRSSGCLTVSARDR